MVMGDLDFPLVTLSTVTSALVRKVEGRTLRRMRMTRGKGNKSETSSAGRDGVSPRHSIGALSLEDALRYASLCDGKTSAEGCTLSLNPEGSASFICRGLQYST